MPAEKCPVCGAYPLLMEAVPPLGTAMSGTGEFTAVCSVCHNPMPAGWTPHAQPMEPLADRSRAELQLNILQNMERLVMQYPKRNAIRLWWEHTFNWVKVQALITGNTSKGGSTSSAQQCRFIGADPDGYSFIKEK